jgi:glycosyltransferase involved in cell wall biosynthesis
MQPLNYRQRRRSASGEPIGRRHPGPARAVPRPLEVCWEAPLFEAIGYGSEARAFVLGLDDLSVPLQARPVCWTGRPCALDATVRQRLLQMTRVPLAGVPVHVHHGFPLHWRRDSKAVRNIGRTMFETDGIPAEWVRACNAMDEIWVPAPFNVETFAASGVRRAGLIVMPGPISTSEFHPGPPAMALAGRRPFRFLSVFDWSWRKGWDILLRAYCTEFRRGHDNVRLLLKVDSSYGRSGRDLRQMVRSFIERQLRLPLCRVPPITVMSRLLPQRQLPGLYRSADCFVLPTRGEGWGRTLMEAMATGLPTIGTRWGGSLAFMHESNAYLCEIDGLVPVPAHALCEAPAFRGHRWAEPSADHLRTLMRHVFQHRAEARRRGRRGRADLARRYDVHVVCRQVADRLVEIAG